MSPGDNVHMKIREALNLTAAFFLKVLHSGEEVKEGTFEVKLLLSHGGRQCSLNVLVLCRITASKTGQPSRPLRCPSYPFKSPYP